MKPPPFRTLLLLACLVLASVVCAAEARPNILLAIGDNWAWPHAGALGDRTARTPVFDRIAREGVLFSHAFCPVPSCSPTRSSLLTGRAAHQLEDAASLWSAFPKKLQVFTDAAARRGLRGRLHRQGLVAGQLQGIRLGRKSRGQAVRELRRIHGAARSRRSRSFSGSATWTPRCTSGGTSADGAARPRSEDHHRARRCCPTCRRCARTCSPTTAASSAWIARSAKPSRDSRKAGAARRHRHRLHQRQRLADAARPRELLRHRHARAAGDPLGRQASRRAQGRTTSSASPTSRRPSSNSPASRRRRK